MQRPKEYTVHEVQAQMQSAVPPRLVDVRDLSEWNHVRLDGGQLLTEELLDEMVNQWPPETPIVCYCHHGIRSLNAAVYLAQRGFHNVSSMRGGIDAWAREIDANLPRY